MIIAQKPYQLNEIIAGWMLNSQSGVFWKDKTGIIGLRQKIIQM